jgi:hypothetical protein
MYESTKTRHALNGADIFTRTPSAFSGSGLREESCLSSIRGADTVLPYDFNDIRTFNSINRAILSGLMLQCGGTWHVNPLSGHQYTILNARPDVHREL